VVERIDNRIAMCWKCSHSSMQRVTEEIPGRDGFTATTMELVGCEIEPAIKDYNDTHEMCPILIELRAKDKEHEPD